MNEKYVIFISYSRSDLKKVKAIKAELERTTHAKCWMDLEGIESGSPQFDEVIVKGIAQSKVFLFMLSSNSQKSEFALNELELARRKARADNGNKKVVLVNIDDCEMTDTFYLRYNRMDIIEWNNDPQRNKLFRDIAKWTNITSEDTKPLTEEGKETVVKKTQEKKLEVIKPTYRRQDNNSSTERSFIEKYKNWFLGFIGLCFLIWIITLSVNYYSAKEPDYVDYVIDSIVVDSVAYYEEDLYADSIAVAE